MGRFIYLIGGDDGELQTGHVDRYEPHTNTWSVAPSLLAQRSYLAAVALRSRLFAMGGYFRVTLKSVESLQLDESLPDDQQPQQQQWSSLPRMRFESRDIAACVVSDHEFLVMSDMEGETRRNHLSVYDLDLETWKPFAPPMSSLRFGASLCFIDGDVYVLGGYNGSKHLASGERITYRSPRDTSNDDTNDDDDNDDDAAMDTSLEQWHDVPSMNSRRVGFAAVAIPSDHTIIVAGGFDGEQVLNTVELYDLRTRTWRTLAPMTRARSYFAYTLFERSIYVFGGYDGQAKTHEVERYLIDCDKWELVGSMTRNAFAAAACVL